MSIDAALGRLGNKSGVCTSSTRPVNPFEGQLIYETDTNRTLVYDNAAWLVVADNQVLSIDSTNGRVGIGTTTPSRLLDVEDGANTTSQVLAELMQPNLATTNSSQIYLGKSAGSNTSSTLTYTYDSGTPADSHLSLGLYGSSYSLNITGGGNVGIGTTSPNSALSVTGVNSETRPLLDLQASLAPGESGAYQRGIRLLNSGMTAGQELLVAVGRSDDTRNQGQMYFQYSGDGSTSNRLSFGLYAVDDVLNITGSGNVGIGDTTPSYKLDVNGDINATGDLRIGGTAVGGWTTFTPTWTAASTNPSIGNGTLRGRYTKVNDLVIAQYDLRMGSTTTFGAGIWYMSFPVAADFTDMFAYMDLGAGRVYDQTAQTVYNLHIIGFNANSTSFRLLVDGPPSHNLDANVPFAWSSGDEVLFTIWYKAA